MPPPDNAHLPAIATEEVQCIVRGQTREMEREGTDAEAIKELQKKLQETALRNEELKNQVKEKDIYRATLEFRFRRKIGELHEELEETDILKKEAESALRDQREYYEKQQQVRDATI